VPGLFGYLNQTTGGDDVSLARGDSSAILLNVINKPNFIMAAIPNFETLLLEIRKSLGLKNRYSTDKNEDFRDHGLLLTTHRAMMVPSSMPSSRPSRWIPQPGGMSASTF
jgi:hypothetical protein